MLEPEYFNDKADRMLEIYRQLEDFIFQDSAGRLLESQAVSGTADRMIWKLKQMGESKTAIINKLAVLTRLSRRELKELLQEAVLTSWEDDLSTFNQMGIPVVNPLENPAVVSIMNAEYKKSLGELKNLTRTTMDQASQDLVRMLDEAEIRVASGVQSYSQAVCDILDNYARKGIQIGYPTGAKRSLEAAVRMCVVTSMNQTSAQITNQYIIEGGVEYVLVSAHLGARTQQDGQPYLAGHENWQGKVYKIHGSEPGYPNLAEMTGYDIDKSGTGKVLNLLGLHGYNCRHSHKPWDKDLKNPYVDENGNPVINQEENKKMYEKQQKQRAMEREVRKTKRELLMKQKQIDMVAETDVKDILQKDYDRLADTLRKQNQEYNEFCEENDLQTQQDRLKVAGFKREQATKARGRARAYEHKEKRNNVSDKVYVAARVAEKNTGKRVHFKEEYDYFVSIEGYSNDINKGLGIACRKVAKAGEKDGCEHMYLVDLKSGELSFYETNGLSDQVGYEYRDYLKRNRNKQYAFVHNHNTDGMFSETDMQTLMGTEQIPIMIAVRNDAIIYVAERNGNALKSVWFDKLYEKELESLNIQSRNGIITPRERSVQREIIIVENVLKDYTKGGKLIEYNGQKK